MFNFRSKVLLALIIFLCLCNRSVGQTTYIISGKVTDSNYQPVQNATVHLKNSNNSTVAKIDGSFRLYTDNWYDSLEITGVGFEPFTIALRQGHSSNLQAEMKKGQIPCRKL